MNEELLIGIDLGGTKIEGIVLHKNKFKTILRKRIPTESHLGYQHILTQIKRLVDSLSNEVNHRFYYLGICTPGTLDPSSQLMKNCNTVVLNGQPFKKDLEERLAIPVRISNDANCFALAEYNYGVIHQNYNKVKNVFGVILGTGVGGGLVINGQLIEGAQGIGGEWGHNVLDSFGEPCYCGKRGCAETIISGPALEKYYYGLSGNHKSLSEIVKDYRMQTDEVAKDTMERLFVYFGIGISIVINIVDPEVVVIGGGLGIIDELYTKGIEEVRKNVFNNRLDTKIVQPLLGDSAGVYGAAFL